MNRPTEPHEPPPPGTEPVLRALDHWQDEIDPVQRARLAAARRRALTVAEAQPRRAWVWLAPALATGLLLAFGIGFWPQAPLPSAPPTPAIEELAVGLPTAGEEPLQDEDLEYLLWLAADDAA
ncbi:hypothetical protein ED208_00560 [Stagnimonas aquatica]|uniref:DUF3619 family protein n=1 Tax=Stagnimonas aquatica TaxID=2689987 RepID=A0A3N0VJX6_9GAMM|nr:hypothetical protein [Stagnimonas aquatica]ROH93063.1 hypothetical protein ED208_00560 [Stagnimonas aquatica]